jgi:uncharacterized membrane protein YbhN (UPF0104 family)
LTNRGRFAALRLAAAAAGLIFLWSLLRREFAFDLPRLDARLPGALGLVALSFTCYAMRFGLVMRNGGLRLRTLQAWRICAAAQFYQSLTPLSVGSDVTRFAMCRTAAPELPPRSLIVAILLDHIVGSIALLLLALPFASRHLISAEMPGLALAGGGAALAGCAMLAWRYLPERLRELRQTLSRHQRATLSAVALSLAMHALLAGAVVMVAGLWQIPVRFSDVVGVLACGALLQVVPVNLLGMHLGDAAGVGLYVLAGLRLPEAILLTSIAWSLRLVIALIGGLWDMASAERARRAASAVRL